MNNIFFIILVSILVITLALLILLSYLHPSDGSDEGIENENGEEKEE